MVDAWRLPLLQDRRFEFVEPTPDGVEHIAHNLRQQDREECFASTGHRRYADAIRLSMAASDSVVMVVSAYSEPVAVLGVATVSLLYNTGCPWMMGTPHVERYRRAFIECGRAYTCLMLEHYNALENHVDARNTKSIAWLHRLGFQIGDPEPYGAFGYPFRPFRIERPMNV